MTSEQPEGMIQSMRAGDELTGILRPALPPQAQWFSKLSMHQNRPEGFEKHKSRDLHYLGLGWDPRIYLPNKLPDATDAAGPGTHFEHHCSCVISRLPCTFWTIVVGIRSCCCKEGRSHLPKTTPPMRSKRGTESRAPRRLAAFKPSSAAASGAERSRRAATQCAVPCTRRCAPLAEPLMPVDFGVGRTLQSFSAEADSGVG